MKRLVASMVVALLAAACASHTGPTKSLTAPTAAAAVPPGTVILHLEGAAQTMQGFGASGAWWPNDLEQFPVSVQQQVVSLLFDQRGVAALSGYRYNIGGGGLGVHAGPRAPHDVAHDSAGLLFLRAAAAAGVPVLTGFVNSAPPQFTTNGKACGGSLKLGAESAFADYLAGVVQHLHDTEHITLNYVSPMNEPDNSFGDCGQEGMAVPVAQRAALVQALAAALRRRAPYAKVIADETTADAILANEAPQWLAVPSTPRDVAAVAHHTYDFPNDAIREQVPAITRRFHVPTWMTEICCYKGSGGVAQGFGANYDPTMTQGLWLADQVYDDLSVANDSAWYWWTALSPVIGCDPSADPQCPTRVNTKGFNDGLFYYDANFATDHVTQLFPTKRYYVLAQFSHYVRPGAVRYPVAGAPAGVRAMAFADHGQWSVVVWNEGASGAQFALQLGKEPLTARGGSRTSDNDNMMSIAPPVSTGRNQWLVTVAPKTVVTYAFS